MFDRNDENNRGITPEIYVVQLKVDSAMFETAILAIKISCKKVCLIITVSLFQLVNQSYALDINVAVSLTETAVPHLCD